MTQIVKKITAKSLGTIPKPHTMVEGSSLVLCTLLGRVDSLAQKNTQYGDYVEFKGVFEAFENGVLVLSSNLAILPQVAENALLAAYNNDTTNSVEFALEIGLQQSDSSPATGYVYTVKPLIPIQESSPLKHLAALIQPSKHLAQIETSTKADTAFTEAEVAEIAEESKAQKAAKAK